MQPHIQSRRDWNNSLDSYQSCWPGLRSGFYGEGGATYCTQYQFTIIFKIIFSQRIHLEISTPGWPTILFTVLYFNWSVSIVHVKSIKRIKGKSDNQSVFLFLFHVQWIKCVMWKILLAVMNPQTAINRLCMCPQLYVDLRHLIVLVDAWVVFFCFPHRLTVLSAKSSDIPTQSRNTNLAANRWT